MIPNDLKFSCSIMRNLDGCELRGLKPDSRGFYPVVVGSVGGPTRNKVIYESKSLLSSMASGTKFNESLRNGYLFGELGHPDVYGKGPQGKDDILRLCTIKEDNVSHLFGKIWIDETPITAGGDTGYPIRALVKPFGPKGEVLRQSLEDPDANTAFSIRTLCRAIAGPDKRYSYREVISTITFDAVCAPGYVAAAKRYSVNAGMESYSEVDVSREALAAIIKQDGQAGMEAAKLFTDLDLDRIYGRAPVAVGDSMIGELAGKHSFYDLDGNLGSSASLIYRNRNR